jgi:hypothetical protein
MSIISIKPTPNMHSFVITSAKSLFFVHIVLVLKLYSHEHVQMMRKKRKSESESEIGPILVVPGEVSVQKFRCWMLFDQFEADGHSGSEDEAQGLDDEKAVHAALMKKAAATQAGRGVVTVAGAGPVIGATGLAAVPGAAISGFRGNDTLGPAGSTMDSSKAAAVSGSGLIEVLPFTDYQFPDAGAKGIICMCTANDVILIASEGGQISRIDLSPEGTGDQVGKSPSIRRERLID